MRARLVNRGSVESEEPEHTSSMDNGFMVHKMGTLTDHEMLGGTMMHFDLDGSEASL